jgi:hypothetical protein
MDDMLSLYPSYQISVQEGCCNECDERNDFEFGEFVLCEIEGKREQDTNDNHNIWEELVLYQEEQYEIEYEVKEEYYQACHVLYHFLFHFSTLYGLPLVERELGIATATS